MAKVTSKVVNSLSNFRVPEFIDELEDGTTFDAHSIEANERICWRSEYGVRINFYTTDNQFDTIKYGCAYISENTHSIPDTATIPENLAIRVRVR